MMTMEIDAFYARQPMRNSLDPCDTCADWIELKAEIERLREFAEEVRRSSDTRLASMAIAVLNATTPPKE